MVMRPEDHQAMGRMEGEISALKEDRDAIRQELRQINQSLLDIKTYIAENRGGVKLLVGLISLTATISSIITYFIGWLKH
jgi:hypothetical protein